MITDELYPNISLKTICIDTPSSHFGFIPNSCCGQFKQSLSFGQENVLGSIHYSYFTVRNLTFQGLWIQD